MACFSITNLTARTLSPHHLIKMQTLCLVQFHPHRNSTFALEDSKNTKIQKKIQKYQKYQKYCLLACRSTNGLQRYNKVSFDYRLGRLRHQTLPPWLQEIQQRFHLQAMVVDFFPPGASHKSLLRLLRDVGFETKVFDTHSGLRQRGNSCGLVAAQTMRIALRKGLQFMDTTIDDLRYCVSMQAMQECNRITQRPENSDVCVRADDATYETSNFAMTTMLTGLLQTDRNLRWAGFGDAGTRVSVH